MDMAYVDLRSDTVTQPTPEMRQAMAQAHVGDDVYREDPTINRLEALAAERLGKPAALFVPSGTMGNLAAILAHCGRGDEIILGDKSHTFLYEAGGASALGGVQVHTLRNRGDGTLSVDEIRGAIRGDDPHYPTSRLIILENTHNRCGGVALTLDYTREVGLLAKEHDLRLHVDGARIFNAAAALGVPAADLVAPADSVTFCLSKGLCAPVGSLLCGPIRFIGRARRARKQLGGGMRQAGILAAAGIVALERMVDRLQDDHALARRLAGELAGIPGIRLDPDSPATNMIYLSLDAELPSDAAQVAALLFKKGVRVGVVAERRFRLVTHHGIDQAAIDRAVSAFTTVLASQELRSGA